MDIEKEVTCVTGQIIDIKDHRYSSTSVEGEISYAPTASSYISSTVRHHRMQDVWVRLDNSQENLYRFGERHIEALPGHHVKIYINKMSGIIERVANLTTGVVWTTGFTYPEKPRMFTSLLAAMFLSIPLWSMLMSFFPIKRYWYKSFVSNQFDKLRVKKILFNIGAILVCFSVIVVLSSDVRRTLPTWKVIVSADTQVAVMKQIDKLVLFVGKFVVVNDSS